MDEKEDKIFAFLDAKFLTTLSIDDLYLIQERINKHILVKEEQLQKECERAIIFGRHPKLDNLEIEFMNRGVVMQAMRSYSRRHPWMTKEQLFRIFGLQPEEEFGREQPLWKKFER